MNRELMPCMAPNCTEPGRYRITYDRGEFYLCPAHTQGLAERLEAEGRTFTRETNDDP